MFIFLSQCNELNVSSRIPIAAPVLGCGVHWEAVRSLEWRHQKWDEEQMNVLSLSVFLSISTPCSVSLSLSLNMCMSPPHPQVWGNYTKNYNKKTPPINEVSLSLGIKLVAKLILDFSASRPREIDLCCLNSECVVFLQQSANLRPQV